MGAIHQLKQVSVVDNNHNNNNNLQIHNDLVDMLQHVQFGETLKVGFKMTNSHIIDGDDRIRFLTLAQDILTTSKRDMNNNLFSFFNSIQQNGIQIRDNINRKLGTDPLFTTDHV